MRKSDGLDHTIDEFKKVCFCERGGRFDMKHNRSTRTFETGDGLQGEYKLRRMKGRTVHRIVRGVLAFAMGTLLVGTAFAPQIATAADGEGMALLNEDFTGSSFGLGEWSLVGESVGLTAAGYKNNNPYGVGKAENTENYIGAQHGDGFLQLTDDSQGQTGTVLYNTPVQTRLGLDITFTQWQFGEESHGDYEADGIGFYLVDGGATLDTDTMGPMGENVGGALGYSAIRADGETHEGIANGVLGVGLDIWGNYSAKEVVGGDDVRDSSDKQGSHKYSVTVRGAGQQVNGRWTNGYGIIDGARVQVDDSYLGTDFPSQNRNGQNESGTSNGVQVNIVISPKDENGDQTITVRLKRENDSNWNTVINEVPLTESLPETVKFGFTASTGQGTDAHYVRGLSVKSVEEAKPGIMLTKRVAGTEGSYPQTYQEGDTVTYEFVVTNTGSTTLNNVTVTDQNISEQITGGKTTLEPQETTTFTVEHVLTKEDVASGLFKNVATATGTDEGGNTVEDTDDETIATIPSVDPLGEPQHTKRIGKNDDGTYTLALDVTGETQTSGGVSTTPVDVVMIVDRSSSMNEDITTTSEVTYVKVGNVVESDGRVYTDTYWDFNWPFQHEYQHAEQTSHPTDTYYVYLNDQYIEVEEKTETVNGERGTSYQKHVSWTANGVDVDPSEQQFYTRRTSSSSMSKMDAVKQAAMGFVNAAAESDGASAMRIGVIQFGSSTSRVIGLTNVATGADSINEEINQIYAPGSGEGTEPENAFNQAKNMLADSTANKVVIFFTDGGPGGTTWDSFNENTANNTINASKALKDSGVTVWSVGVFDGADPAESIDNTSNNSNNSKKMNAYMHATSSNYPQANGFSDNSRGQGSNAGYYQAASTSEQLNEIFQDIFHDSTKTQAYGNVSIVDELSQWAQIADSVTWNDSQDAHTDNGYPVTAGVTLEVKDASGNTVNLGDENYPNEVAFYYEPATSGATDTTGAIKAVFGSTYQLQDSWTYTLKFNVVPTDAAYDDYAQGGEYPNIGEEGTDLYDVVTSSGEPGFNSNNHAYVQYTADDEEQSADYKHPVLQVETLTIEGVLNVTKTMKGHTLDASMFDFTVTPVDDASEQKAFGGTTAESHDYVNDAGDSNNSDVIHVGEKLTFTEKEVDNTYSYTYDESDSLHKGYTGVTEEEVDFDTNTYRIDLTVGKDENGKLLVAMSKFVNDSEEPIDTVVINSDNCKPDKPLMTVDFVNEYHGFDLVIYKYVKGDDGNIAKDGAKFTVTGTGDVNLGEVETGSGDNADGEAKFTGLTSGVVYTISETWVPSGYTMSEDKYFTIVNGEAILTDAEGNYDKDDPIKLAKTGSTFRIEIENTEIPSLPASGSSGTIAMSTVGVATVVVAGCYLALRLKLKR